jgi:isochorismate pyruvate lyase
MLAPEECMTMTDVRLGVDKVDQQIAALIGRRFGYMDAAARIKAERSMVRDEARKTQVLGNAKANARSAGWSPDLAEQLWEALVEASIAYELEAFDAR